MPNPPTDRIVRCRYLGRGDQQCTAEALDSSPDTEILICRKHAGRVLRLVAEKRAMLRATDV